MFHYVISVWLIAVVCMQDVQIFSHLQRMENKMNQDIEMILSLLRHSPLLNVESSVESAIPSTSVPGASSNGALMSEKPQTAALSGDPRNSRVKSWEFKNRTHTPVGYQRSTSFGHDLSEVGDFSAIAQSQKQGFRITEHV